MEKKEKKNNGKVNIGMCDFSNAVDIGKLILSFKHNDPNIRQILIDFNEGVIIAFGD